MTRHLHITAATQVAWRDMIAQVAAPDVMLAGCHQRLRGPYTGVDTLLTAVLPEANRRWPDLVEQHRVELLYGMPELAELIGAAPETLVSISPFLERTRFFGNGMIRCMNQGIVTFLIEYYRRRQLAGLAAPTVAFGQVQHAEPTTQEFIALLVRRIDPALLRVIVGTDGVLGSDGVLGGDGAAGGDGAIGGELGAVLAAPAVKRLLATAAPRAGRGAPARDQVALLAAYLDSDCTSDDPAELAAYQSLGDDERASAHDQRAAVLAVDPSWGIRVGALAYHREHGSDPTGLGRTALLAAQQFCVETGFSAAVAELGERGRAVSDPVTEQESFCAFSLQAAAALVPLGRLAESIELYRELRRRYSAPKLHMLTSYMIAMMHTRFLSPRDHDQALEWQNNAVAIANILPDDRDRLVYGVFHDNAVALIQMHRGALDTALTLVEDGMGRLDAELGVGDWVLHRSQLLYNRARLLSLTGRLDEAYDDFSTLIELDPYYTDYFSERAKVSRMRGDLEAALADYDSAAALAPPFPELYYNRGTAYAELGRPQQALLEFDYVLDMEPDDLASRVSRVEILLGLGDLAAAQADVTQGLALRPADPQLLCLESSILLEQGRPDLARDRLNLVIGSDPGYPAALVNRAVALFQLGHPDLAVLDLTATLRLTGDNPDVLLNRGLALRAAGQHELALADFTRAMELPGADLAELRTQLAELQAPPIVLRPAEERSATAAGTGPGGRRQAP